jgi:glutamine amidotransferase
MTRPEIVVLDYGFGNVRSAVRAVERAGGTARLTADRDAALAADGLVVPGVGAFGAVARALAAVGGPWIIDHRLAAGKAVFGICVGMQVMFAWGDERGARAEGLGRWPDAVTRLRAPIVPHMGWANVEAPAASALFEGVGAERFYFVHSYGAQTFKLAGEIRDPAAAPLVTWADHGGPFVAAVEDGPLVATQFHPEKSGDAGARLLRNWLATLPGTATPNSVGAGPPGSGKHPSDVLKGTANG